MMISPATSAAMSAGALAIRSSSQTRPMPIATSGSVTVRMASTGAMSELSWKAFWLSRNPIGSRMTNA